MKKYNLLKKCIKKQSQISIERKAVDDEPITAIPIAMSKKLLLIHYLYDFQFDGFKVLTMKDISRVKRGKVEKFHDKILKKEKIKKSVSPDVKVDSWRDFFHSITKENKLIDISLERKTPGSEQTFFVGKVVSVNKKSINLLEISTLGIYDPKRKKYRFKLFEGGTKIKFKDITAVSFGNRYSEVLDKFSKEEWI